MCWKKCERTKYKEETVEVAIKNDPEEVVESAQCGPFVVVWKSMDEVHYPGKERRTFRFCRKPVKGSVIIDEIIRAQLSEPRFTKRFAALTPRELMLELNACINSFQVSEKLPLGQADELCGVRMVVAKECGSEFQIAYIGDCFAVWETRCMRSGSGSLRMTENQAYAYNYRMYAMIEKYWNAAASCMKLDPAAVEQGTDQWNSLRLEMWRLFGPRLQMERRLHINNPAPPDGHGVMNGQSESEGFVVESVIPKLDLEYILLGNNGCTPWDMEKDVSRQRIATELSVAANHAYNLQTGIRAVIAQARWYENNTKISHAKGGRADAACALIKP
ncbi:hypothetical protein HYV71_05090 [Candidatus Uhrbacteria bacterium]|nr:hypothetical protein [Candidatus Uhrbacteria bacterium]